MAVIVPKGPNGEYRPGDVVGGAVHVAKIATGEVEEVEYTAPGRRKSGKAGGKARAKKLNESERTKIAKKAASARWG